MSGQVFLLCTNEDAKKVEAFFDTFAEDDFALAGTIANKTVFLSKGVEAFANFTHSIEPYLRQLGLPTRLNNQKIELLADTYVCKEGKPINVEQSKILKQLGYKMGKFQFKVMAKRTKAGKFKEFIPVGLGLGS